MASTGNPYSTFYEQPTGNTLNKAMMSGYNVLAGTGQQATSTGQQTTASGVNAMGPVLSYLTQLTKGDQADISQATQPQTNQIKDSFAAIRNMISQQPRGGGKAGALAEAPYKQEQQIGDMQQQARAGAAGQLGQLSSTLAGLGVSEQDLGLRAQTAADTATLTRREQDMGPGSFASQFSGIVSAIGTLV